MICTSPFCQPLVNQDITHASFSISARNIFGSCLPDDGYFLQDPASSMRRGIYQGYTVHTVQISHFLTRLNRCVGVCVQAIYLTACMTLYCTSCELRSCSYFLLCSPLFFSFLPTPGVVGGGDAGGYSQVPTQAIKKKCSERKDISYEQNI